MSELAIIILNWNGANDTIECLNSIKKNENYKYNIFLLDNNSEKKSIQSLKKWINSNWREKILFLDANDFLDLKDYNISNFFLIRSDENLGFAKGNNFVLRKIKNKFNYFLLLNNDTVIGENSITKMLKYQKENSKTKVLSCDIRLYSTPEKLWNAGGYFTWYGDRKYYSQSKIDNLIEKEIISIESPFVTGCAMMVENDIIDKNGLFTEKFFFGEEDFNLCKKLNKNDIKVETLLTTTIYHKVGQSREKSKNKEVELFKNYLLHFSNRIIDQKEFYNNYYWIIWKIAYLIAIFLKFYKNTKNLNKSQNLIKKINYYSSNYNEINYDLFREIMGMQV